MAVLFLFCDRNKFIHKRYGFCGERNLPAFVTDQLNTLVTAARITPCLKVYVKLATFKTGLSFTFSGVKKEAAF